MSEFRIHPVLMGVLAALPMACLAGGGSVDRKVPASANGEVVISNVSGSVDVRGWDRDEVQVTGHLDGVPLPLPDPPHPDRDVAAAGRHVEHADRARVAGLAPLFAQVSDVRP